MNKNINKLIEFTNRLDILFVEDNEDVRTQLIKFLENFFNSIDSTCDGQEALKTYQKDKYDLIITDISMPKLDGIELCKIVKQQHIEQKIIVLSAHTETEKLDKLKKLGITEILQKPITHECLIDALERLFELDKV